MQKHHRWLQAELVKWVDEQLIDDKLADALRERYAITERAWGRVIFSAIGAVLVGLGVILFFAYNWQALPKAAKLGVVFVSIIASHGSALWLGRTGTLERSGLVESLHLLGTMLFGAGIWLVAQIYHIDAHYPNAILVWGLGALALAWVMPSLAQGFLAVLLIALWSVFESTDFGRANHGGPLMMVFAIVPLAWALKSRVLLFMGLLGVLAVTTLTVAAVEEELILTVFFFSGSAFVAIGLISGKSAFDASQSVLKSLGFAAYLSALYFLSFPFAVNILANLHVPDLTAFLYFFIPLGLACVSWGVCLWRLSAELDELWRYHGYLVGLSTLLTVVLALAVEPAGWAAAAPFNVFFLGHCVLLIVQGTRHSNAKLVGIACTLFAILVMTRYADLFESLLWRAGVFLLLGAGLFFVGNLYARRAKSDQEVVS